jgi:hypothetical protein
MHREMEDENALESEHGIDYVRQKVHFDRKAVVTTPLFRIKILNLSKMYQRSLRTFHQRELGDAPRGNYGNT